MRSMMPARPGTPGRGRPRGSAPISLVRAAPDVVDHLEVAVDERADELGVIGGVEAGDGRAQQRVGQFIGLDGGRARPRSLASRVGRAARGRGA